MGQTFVVSFDLRQSLRGGYAGMKVWVVDDDQAICSLLKIMLSAKGHEVDTYQDPTATPILQGRESCCSAEAMLVDYFMPNMNGLDFLKELEARDCQVVKGNRAIITAHHSPELERELEFLGVVCFTKPFQLPAITRWLEACEQRISASRR